jgi:hypothetical protein
LNYHYYSKEKARVLYKLTQNELFSPLVEYLAENKEKRVILRELKQQFPQKKFEHFLDQLIEHGLIIRHERAYELGFPVFGKAYQEEHAEEINRAAEILLEQLEAVSPMMQQQLIAETIWAWRFTENEYFYGQTAGNTAEKYEAGNEKYRFISDDQQDKVSLAVYFAHQREQLPLPERFRKLEKLIGDVDEEYYFNQAEVIIEKVLAGKYKKRRPSIFHDSLIEAGVIEQKEEVYSLMYPLIQEQEVSIDFPELTGSSNHQAFMKSQIYGCLLEQLPEGFCYIKEIV